MADMGRFDAAALRWRRMTIPSNVILVAETSPASSAAIDFQKIILVVFRFFEFSPNQDPDPTLALAQEQRPML
jgi:hypothetical protein